MIKGIALVLLSFVIAAGIVTAEWIAFRPKAQHVNPCTANAGECYSIQGLTSWRSCPGQHAWFIEIDGYSFFMGCRQ